MSCCPLHPVEILVVVHHYLTVDGVRSATGLRVPFTGEYLELKTLPVTAAFHPRFATWVQRYQHAYDRYDETGYEAFLQALDEEGIQLAKELKDELGSEVKVTYYSDAFNTSLLI